MALLKRVLYLQAAVTALLAVALLALPKFVLISLFGQAPHPEYAWVRISGIEALGLAMFMVLVAHRAAEVWWWSWAFVIVTGFIAVIAAFNALIGLPDGASPVLWWLLAGGNAGFCAALLWGLGRTGQERPLP
jgi:hypothetical protein